MSSTDQTFITNEAGQTLVDRFGELIRDTRLFDVLVGYFYTSGFHEIYKSLEAAEKIRILVGISTDKKVVDMLAHARQEELPFFDAEVEDEFADKVIAEMDASKDTREVEEGVAKFIEWLQNGKLEIRAYPTRRLHAKLYIMTFAPGDRDAGRVITGSSNFTEAGLKDNLEFNVELKGRADYDFAKAKFEELWAQGVDVKDRYIATIQGKTWLNDEIKPYELYLKFLYEYFRDELGQTISPDLDYAPEGFRKLKYQAEAVYNAKRILEEYGGVFLSDVVGLGKTYMAVMLARELDGRTLVVAPPALLDQNNPGSWPRAFADFKMSAECRSFGMLDQVIEDDADRHKNVIIDEAHRYRSESNTTYEKMAQICRGKRVILVTATPFNNSPRDILSEVKLFQPGKKSSIPNLANLEGFFRDLAKKLKKYNRKTDPDRYMDQAADNAKRIRESVLKYLMVRRTRHEIQKYFGADLKKQGMAFPKVEDPTPAYYKLNKTEDAVFDETVKLITQKLTYARYMPMVFYQGEDLAPGQEQQAQKNLGAFMKILLVKRLESSFHAFKKTVERFIERHEGFLKAFEAGEVYVSKKYTDKIFDLLDIGDDAAIQRLVDGDRAESYKAADFSKTLGQSVRRDLKVLKDIQKLWADIKRDPKLLEFIRLLEKDKILAEKKLIVFTESRETAEYLSKELRNNDVGEVLSFSGGATAAARRRVVENFDANARTKKDDYRVLITTEVLSEGVNLHRANVVINYDIPWNPTRMMQRVGRINRVDTTFKKIYTYNFFPTAQADSEIKLEKIAASKIRMFISLLGADARLLTDGEEIKSFELFGRITSKAGITGEVDEIDGELKYSEVIKRVRDTDPALFARIRRLPKKARTARRHDGENALLTYFRKGKLQKFFLAGDRSAKEVDFLSAAALLEAEPNTKRVKAPADFYAKLDANKNKFADATAAEYVSQAHRGQDSARNLLVFLAAIKNSPQYTETQEMYIAQVMARLEEGALPRQTITTTWRAVKRERATGESDPLKILARLQAHIPHRLLQRHRAETPDYGAHSGEVILSEYLVARDG